MLFSCVADSIGRRSEMSCVARWQCLGETGRAPRHLSRSFFFVSPKIRAGAPVGTPAHPQRTSPDHPARGIATRLSLREETIPALVSERSAQHQSQLVPATIAMSGNSVLDGCRQHLGLRSGDPQRTAPPAVEFAAIDVLTRSQFRRHGTAWYRAKVKKSSSAALDAA
jgi:hypothetical protein